ncbi:hypothetical protein D5282_05630 [bacterium 1xD8-48]|nr:hypothetical protein [bacterium 1xD8-48]
MNKMKGKNAVRITVRAVKILLSSIAVYYILDIRIEELFWIIGGIVFIAYCEMERERMPQEKGKRAKAVFFMVSCYIAVVLVLGLRYYEEVQHSLMEWIVSFAGLLIFFYESICYAYNMTSRWKGRAENLKESWRKKEKSFLSGCTKGRRIFSVGLVFFLGWLPMLLANYPGFMMYDSSEQWYQAIGEWNLNNHHPVWHTLLIKAGVWLSSLIFGEIVPEYGVLIYTLLQMVIMSIIFSVVVEWLYESVHKSIWIGSILYYLLFPIHSIQGISMVKDSIFGCFVLLLTAQVYKLYLSHGEWGKGWKNMLGITFTMLGIVFFRNNGFAVVLLTGLVLFLFYKNIRKQIFISGITVAVCFLLQNTVIFRAFDIQQTKLAEAIGMPINQIANIVSHDRELTENEKNLIEAVMPLEEIKEKYNVHYTDSIKFSESYRGYVIEQSKKTYLKLWLTLLCKYPGDCIEASLNLTIGFWYPGVSKGAVSLAMEEKDFYLKEIGIETQKLKLRNKIFDSFMGDDIRESTLFSGFFSIGNFVILIFLLCAFVLVRKGRKALSIFLPFIAVWLTLLIATPSYCETRYIYSAFTVIPVYIAGLGNNIYGKKAV